MNRFALALIAFLYAGCASSTTYSKTDKLFTTSHQNVLQLQAALRDTSAELRNAITQGLEERLHNSSLAESVSNPAHQGVQALLFDFLTHTSNKILLADAAFGKLNSTVYGENQQLQQSFATALTGYLTQSEFACQQPIFYRYFNQKFAPGQKQECTADVPFSVLTGYDGAHIVWVDPKRVKSIHLLFASKSESMVSRFGHVALRLIICPKSKISIEECDENLTEHLVLGFRAYIDDYSIKMLKGLFGGYNAYLFASHFMDVYKEYAIDEFRDIFSVPLRLDDAQRELMVRELADIHWRYSGEYRFFTRNCATMLQNSLHSLWPDFAANDAFANDYLRPDSMFDAVRFSSLADGNKLLPTENAERDGYYFSNTRQFYDRAIKEVKVSMKKPAFIDLDDYLRIHPIKRRENWNGDDEFLLKIAADQHLHEAQIMLEEYAVLRSERLLLIEGTKYIEQQDYVSNADGIHRQLDAAHTKVFDDCLLAPIKQRTNPLRNVGGIPKTTDTSGALDKMSTCHSALSKKLLHEAIAAIRDAASEQWQKLNDISQYCVESIENVNLLKQLP